MKRIHLVVATRPNYMKIAPLWNALSTSGSYQLELVHTGQHYDHLLSGAFWDELKLPRPVVNLRAGSGSHARQTAAVLVGYEAFLQESRPDLVIVPGDVNSTLACALAASKLHVPVAHLEAGLRSFDDSMPEEINRRLTDSLASIHWTPSPDATDNLLREGIAQEKITLVGNCMIDSLLSFLPSFEAAKQWEDFGVKRGEYVVATLHRPINTDIPQRLESAVNAFVSMAKRAPVIWPCHPRTLAALEKDGHASRLHASGVRLCDPAPYIKFMSLVIGARAVVTDSGGIQEETTVLGVPCLTVRPNTERPITCSEGTNRLVEPQEIEEAFMGLDRAGRGYSTPELWDGKAALRIVADLAERGWAQYA